MASSLLDPLLHILFSFSDAQTLCTDYGGLLAEIRDEDEMTMLRTRILRKYVMLLPMLVLAQPDVQIH